MLKQATRNEFELYSAIAFKNIFQTISVVLYFRQTRKRDSFEMNLCSAQELSQVAVMHVKAILVVPSFVWMVINLFLLVLFHGVSDVQDLISQVYSLLVVLTEINDQLRCLW